MRILHLISSGGMYGAEAVILTLSRDLNAQGHSSSIATFTSTMQPNFAFNAAARLAGVRLDAVSCSGQIDPKTLAGIRALVQTLRPEVVHTHGYKADIYGWLALRKVGLPLVSSCHTWYDNDFYLRVYGVVDRWVLRRFASVVAVSQEVRQQLLKAGVSPSKATLISNGVDTAPFTNLQPEKRIGTLRVGLVGRLAPEKGVDLFIQAAAQLLRVVPDAEFIVVGDGPDRSRLEALVQDLGLAAQVRLAGRCDDMPAFYESLSLLVSSSRQEGLPIALLEGMASALPLVATDVGEVSRLVQHGVTGLLVPAEQLSALVAAIGKLLNDAENRRRFGLAGRQRILAEFSAQNMSEAYLKFYQRVLCASAGAPGRLP